MKSHEKYMLDRRSIPAKAAMICLAISVLCRIVGGLLDRTFFEDRFALVEFLMPVACSMLLLLCILLFGRKGFWTSVIPFVCLMMAFVLRLFTFDNLRQIELPLNIVLISMFGCLALAALYAATVFGARTKWLLFVLLLAALAGHVWFELVPAFQEGGWLSVTPVCMEISVLFLFFTLLFVSVGMTRKHRERPPRPDHGSEPVPPVPEEKPPVAEKTPKEPAPIPAAEQEKPKPEPKKPEPTPEKASEAPPAVKEPEVKKPEPEEEYDPFAPSTGPIKLTLNPVGFSVEADDTSGADHS